MSPIKKHLLLLLLSVPSILICMFQMSFVLPFDLSAWFGSDVHGTIVQKIEHRSDWHEVVFSYAVDGKQYTHQVQVKPEVYAKSQIGQPVDIRVFPLLPDKSQIPKFDTGYWEPHWGTTASLREGMPIVIYWVLVPVYVWYWPLRQKALIRDGVATPGRITRKYIRKNRQQSMHYAEYEYPVGSGSSAVLHTASMGLSKKQYQQCQENSAVTIVYHPSKPEQSCIYRYSYFQAGKPIPMKKSIINISG